MSRKATAVAAANIAFVKYWGARDLEAALPFHPSISMTLDRCRTRTTVEHDPDARGPDAVRLLGDEGLREAPEPFSRRVRRHLDRIREHTGTRGAFSVATANSFPADAGIASSASGFAALAVAAAAALGLELEPAGLSTLSRLGGSGSAARSVLGGYVEWPAVEGPEEAAARSLAPREHWALRDLVVLVHSGAKAVSSLEGHARAPSSPHFATRQRLLPGRLEVVRAAIAARDLDLLGPVLEEEAIDLHLVAMSSRPPIFYWEPATLEVLAAVRGLREDGIGAWATMDAGANVHVVCEAADEPAAAAALEALSGVHGLLRDRVGPGPAVVEEHLF